MFLLLLMHFNILFLYIHNFEIEIWI